MLLGLLVIAVAQTVTARNESKLDGPIGGECRIDNLSIRYRSSSRMAEA
jgi:hypothetical protein